MIVIDGSHSQLGVQMIEDNIKKVLDGSKFGLTKDEIASRIGINEKNAVKFLDKMASQGSVTKTKAGRAVFYKSKIIIVFFLILFMVSEVHSMQLNSTSFNITSETVNTGGGYTFSNTYATVATIGNVYGLSSSITYNACAGFLCNFLEFVFVTGGKITFLLEFNISGNANDTAFVDNYTTYKLYRSADILNYYACIHDTSLNNSPAFGIIAAGSLNYINLSSGNSSVLRLSQDIAGNRFIIPITSGNCTIFNTRLSQIRQYGTALQPFVLANDLVNAMELALSYPAIDIMGSFDRSGALTMTIEKNETNSNQIIIRPV